MVAGIASVASTTPVRSAATAARNARKAAYARRTKPCANLMAAPVYHAGAAFCGWISFADDAPFAALKSWPGRTAAHGEHDVIEHKNGITLLDSDETSERTFAIKMLKQVLASSFNWLLCGTRFREGCEHDGAVARTVLDFDRATVKRRDFPYQRQAQPYAPVFPAARLVDAENGWNTLSRCCSGIPKPSSSMRTRTRSPSSSTVTSTVEAGRL